MRLSCEADLLLVAALTVLVEDRKGFGAVGATTVYAEAGWSGVSVYRCQLLYEGHQRGAIITQ